MTQEHLPVALWSNLPSGFINNRIVPNLWKRGYRVVKFLDHRTKEMDLSGVEAVLALTDHAGHKDTDRLQNITNSQNKEIFSFSRRQASWDKDLPKKKDLEEKMGTSSISYENIPAFLKAYRNLREEGIPHVDMMPSLKKILEPGATPHGILSNQ